METVHSTLEHTLVIMIIQGSQHLHTAAAKTKFPKGELLIFSRPATSTVQKELCDRLRPVELYGQLDWG